MAKQHKVFLKHYPMNAKKDEFFVSRTLNVLNQLPGTYISMEQAELLVNDPEIDVEIDLPASNKIL